MLKVTWLVVTNSSVYFSAVKQYLFMTSTHGLFKVVPFKQIFLNKNCWLQRDSNMYRRSRWQARWSLDHHRQHGRLSVTSFCFIFVFSQFNDKYDINWNYHNLKLRLGGIWTQGPRIVGEGADRATGLKSSLLLNLRVSI